MVQEPCFTNTSGEYSDYLPVPDTSQSIIPEEVQRKNSPLCELSLNITDRYTVTESTFNILSKMLDILLNLIYVETIDTFQ